MTLVAEKGETGYCGQCFRVCGMPHDMVDRVARYVWHKYSDWAGLEDIEQELWLWWFTDQVRLGEMFDEKPNLVRHMMFCAATDYARRQKAWYCGYEPSDHYYYSKGMLRSLLPSVFGGDIASEGGCSVDGPRGQSGGNLDTMLIDVKAALETLDEPDRQTLFHVYGQWADKPTRSPAYDRAQRLLRKLQDALGGPPS